MSAMDHGLLRFHLLVGHWRDHIAYRVAIPSDWLSIGGDLAPSLGDGKKLISTPKFLNTFLFSHRPYFVCFASLSCLIYWYITYNSSISEKVPSWQLFLLSSYFYTHPCYQCNTTSPNIGGRMHGPSPNSNFLGHRPPDPLSLRPYDCR